MDFLASGDLIASCQAGLVEGFFLELKKSRRAVKFSLFLLELEGWGFWGVSIFEIWIPRFTSGGGGSSFFGFIDFSREDVASPLCF